MKWLSLVFVVALTGCHAPARPAPPVVAPASGDAHERVVATRAVMKSARYAFEPPHNGWQTRDASTVLRMDASMVTPEWVMLQIADMQSVADDDTQSPQDRAAALAVAADAEGLLIEHFTSLFWNKIEPGRRVLAYLQRALALDPNNEDAAVAYTLSLFGIRKSGFRTQAEETMGVHTGRELERTAPLLARHRGSLRAQSLLRATLTALQRDGQLIGEATSLAAGLDDRIEALRGRDSDLAEDVDEQLRRFSP